MDINIPLHQVVIFLVLSSLFGFGSNFVRSDSIPWFAVELAVAESIDTLTPYLRHCLSLGIEKTFEYWKERNKRISLLADNSPTHYEYLKKHIYT